MSDARIKGGQGRSDDSVRQDADSLALIAGLAFLALIGLWVLSWM